MIHRKRARSGDAGRSYNAAPRLGLAHRFRNDIQHQDSQLRFDRMTVARMRKKKVIHQRIGENQPKEKPCAGLMLRKARPSPQKASAEEVANRDFLKSATTGFSPGFGTP